MKTGGPCEVMGLRRKRHGAEKKAAGALNFGSYVLADFLPFQASTRSLFKDADDGGSHFLLAILCLPLVILSLSILVAKSLLTMRKERGKGRACMIFVLALPHSSIVFLIYFLSMY